jgi:succinate dehydrogenase flavin-adding protein (antitoxin of CptAB toxin-antitoxin module)
MRELDGVLARFLQTSYESLGAEDKRRFRELLDLPDPDLHAYLLGRHDSSDPELDRLLERVRRCARA